MAKPNVSVALDMNAKLCGSLKNEKKLMKNKFTLN